MPMLRLELHLFLWVTAAAFVALAIFRSSADAPPILFDQDAVPAVATKTAAPPASALAIALLPDQFASLDHNSRPIFAVPAEPPRDLPNDVVADHPSVLPVLKGIVSSEAELRAVFASPPDVYLVLGVGDRVADFTIVSISANEVLARDSAGQDRVLPLRGPGEN
jgi:hypothetical protein